MLALKIICINHLSGYQMNIKFSTAIFPLVIIMGQQTIKSCHRILVMAYELGVGETL